MYKLYKTDPKNSNADAVMTIGVEPFKSFLMNPDNTDYQQYLAWLAEGNVPTPAEEQQ